MESHFWLSFGRHHTTSSGSAETWVPRVGGRSPQLHWLVIRHELIPNGDCPLILGPRKSAGFCILTRPISYHAICEHLFWDILERAPQAKWIHYSLTHFWISVLSLELLLGSLLKMLESGKWALWEAGFSISFFLQTNIFSVSFLSNPFYLWKKTIETRGLSFWWGLLRRCNSSNFVANGRSWKQNLGAAVVV